MAVSSVADCASATPPLTPDDQSPAASGEGEGCTARLIHASLLTKGDRAVSLAVDAAVMEDRAESLDMETAVAARGCAASDSGGVTGRARCTCTGPPAAASFAVCSNALAAPSVALTLVATTAAAMGAAAVTLCMPMLLCSATAGGGPTPLLSLPSPTLPPLVLTAEGDDARGDTAAVEAMVGIGPPPGEAATGGTQGAEGRREEVVESAGVAPPTIDADCNATAPAARIGTLTEAAAGLGGVLAVAGGLNGAMAAAGTTAAGV